jgi:hypothetical protein
VGTLVDEYMHVWNQHMGRGLFLESAAAETHLRMERLVMRGGTKSLTTVDNRIVHQLEALNFVRSDVHVPRFVRPVQKQL